MRTELQENQHPCSKLPGLPLSPGTHPSRRVSLFPLLPPFSRCGRADDAQRHRRERGAGCLGRPPRTNDDGRPMADGRGVPENPWQHPRGAVDQDSPVLDLLVQSRRTRQAAKKVFRQLLTG